MTLHARSVSWSRSTQWFFAPWNAEEVRDPKSQRSITAFHEAPDELLTTDPHVLRCCIPAG